MVVCGQAKTNSIQVHLLVLAQLYILLYSECLYLFLQNMIIKLLDAGADPFTSDADGETSVLFFDYCTHF